MLNPVIVELVGVLAALLVFVSYLFTSQVPLRIVNIIASLIFVLYGFFIAANSGWVNGWTTVGLNAGCSIVHIVWLAKHKNNKDNS